MAMLGARPALGQFAMPDPKEMSGIPRPVPIGDLPDRTVSVRLIRGALSNNIAGHPVELVIDGKAQTVKTDENGRAEFGPLAPGARLKAVAVVDGERLESQEFPAPSSGGIRVMLVATDKELEARKAAEAALPGVPGEVSIGRESQLVVEPDEEIVRVYYLLNLTNPSSSRVEPSTPFAFDVPVAATSATIMEGSSPQAAVTGRRVRVQGPFAPGNTFVQVAYVLPATGGEVHIEQAFPVTLEHLAVIVKKVGDAKLEGPQLARQREMPAAGETYIAAAGERAVTAGQPVVLTISGLPHHSAVPRYVALTAALAIMLVGAWAVRLPGPAAGSRTERKRLVARRDKLFQELVRLEADTLRGRTDAAKSAARREQLIDELEQIYSDLDTDDPEPAGRPGLAA
jgi:hypothetical protein